MWMIAYLMIVAAMVLSFVGMAIADFRVVGFAALIAFASVLVSFADEENIEEWREIRKALRRRLLR